MKVGSGLSYRKFPKKKFPGLILGLSRVCWEKKQLCCAVNLPPLYGTERLDTYPAMPLSKKRKRGGEDGEPVQKTKKEIKKEKKKEIKRQILEKKGIVIVPKPKVNKADKYKRQKELREHKRAVRAGLAPDATGANQTELKPRESQTAETTETPNGHAEAAEDVDEVMGEGDDDGDDDDVAEAADEPMIEDQPSEDNEPPAKKAKKAKKDKKDKKSKKTAKVTASTDEATDDQPIANGSEELALAVESPDGVSGDAETDAIAKAKTEKKAAKKDKKQKKQKALADETAAEDTAGDGTNVATEEQDAMKEKKTKKSKKRQALEEEPVQVEEQAATLTETIGNADTTTEKQEKKEKKSKKQNTSTVGSESATNGTIEEKDATVTTVPATSSSATYQESAALAGIPESEITSFLATHEISVTDPLSPKNLRPVTQFQYLPSSTLISKSPFAAFKAPTPIQAASWPFGLAGRDIVGVAETGSGKTMAFGLPCVEAVLRMPKAKGPGRIRAVIVSPTRELAMQTNEQLSKLGDLVGLKTVCVYGGAPKDDQRMQLRKADMIVATPGRLKDFLEEGAIKLDNAGFVVLDEADRMLDKGFEDDIKLIIGKCKPNADHGRQTLMFTATWPQSVQALASSFMVSPVKIRIAGNESGDLQANTRIEQKVEVVDPRGKEQRLLQILKAQPRNEKILVFCLYKKEATRVEGFLTQRGLKVVGIHGDLRQEQRTRSLEAFKSGATPILVATDVAARGLDIPEVKLVVNCTVSPAICASLSLISIY
jgi:ATP-dependent RNA helicase DBP3